jgi:DNA-binding response OmpR family regulator
MAETVPLIAVVEDEEHLAQGLIYNLEAEGYRVHHEADGDAALAWLLAADPQPAAVLMDVMLPGCDGFSIVRAMREAGLFTPVLLLTARGRTEDIVEGFEAGADDYLPKPFDLAVLFARVVALRRRMHWQREAPVAVAEEPEEAATPDYKLGDRTISFEDLEIRTEGAKTIHLTLMEADLLRYLIERANKIVPRKEILENVWHVREDTDTRAIDNFIVRLRRYLEEEPTSPKHLMTVRGVGYRFVPEG